MVQPRKVNTSSKNKAVQKQQQQVEVVSTPVKNTNQKHNHKNHAPVHKTNQKKDNYYNPFALRKVEPTIANPNLTKKDMKMIEKIQAKIEYHEIRDEYDEVDKLRARMVDIEDNANLKAMKKAEKMAAAA